MLSILIPSVVMRVPLCCQFSECHRAVIMLSVIKLRAIILSGIMLSFIMQSVVVLIDIMLVI
jgi:hypothetical protein